MKTPRLSKSKIIAARQCLKRLYLDVHHPELQKKDSSIRAIGFGNDFGRIARGLYSDGYLIEHDAELHKALTETAERLPQLKSQPLFEATFQYNGVLVRADILNEDNGERNLIEVKGSTGVKPYYLEDSAIQTWVMEGAGCSLDSIQIGHVNNQFVYRKEGDYQGIMACVEVTNQVRELLPRVPEWHEESVSVVLGGEPDIEPGGQCHQPYDCPYIGYCTKDVEMADYPVGKLPRGGRLAAALIEEGITDIRDIPEGRLTNDTHIRIAETIRTGNAFLDSAASDILAALSYPRYYLDFEGIQFSVPIWLNTRPYQQLPFQWSCHIEQQEGTIDHLDFLDISGDSPMRAFAESLIDCCGRTGPILVYNQSYENTVIRGLAQMFPDLSETLLALVDRVVDLLPIARKHYYHPEMHGSWSIKSILPCVAPDLDYKDLEEVQDGGGAQLAFLEAMDHATPEARREQLRKNMLEYCKLDTWAMVRLAHYFERKAAAP